MLAIVILKQQTPIHKIVRDHDTELDEELDEEIEELLDEFLSDLALEKDMDIEEPLPPVLLPRHLPLLDRPGLICVLLPLPIPRLGFWTAASATFSVWLEATASMSNSRSLLTVCCSGRSGGLAR